MQRILTGPTFSNWAKVTQEMSPKMSSLPAAGSLLDISVLVEDTRVYGRISCVIQN